MRVTGAGSKSVTKRIPIYHLHGNLVPSPSTDDISPPTDGIRFGNTSDRDAIVAPEATYTKISGSLFPWPQVTFLHYANTTKLALVGHSLSDPNLRRWLAWSAEARSSRPSRRTPMHLWLRKRPPEASDAELLEQSVHHMGIRIAWLDSWADLEHGLRNLTGFTAESYDAA